MGKADSPTTTSADSGTLVIALSGQAARSGMFVVAAGKPERGVNSIRRQVQTALTLEEEEATREVTKEVARIDNISLKECDKKVHWSTEDYIAAHMEVVR